MRYKYLSTGKIIINKGLEDYKHQCKRYKYFMVLKIPFVKLQLDVDDQEKSKKGRIDNE